MTALAPCSVDEVCQAMPGGPYRIEGTGTKRGLGSAEGETLSLARLSGVIEFNAADQVVVVRVGTPIAELQQALAEEKHCLPLPLPEVGFWPSGAPGTVGGLVASRLPHALEAQTGGVRDWLLGLTLVRADGTLVDLPCRAVKSVAGYNVARLMCGARGTLGVLVAAYFRTFPLRALPEPALEVRDDVSGEEPLWIQRVARTDFDRVKAESLWFAADSASCTLWGRGEPVRVPGDWLIADGGWQPKPGPEAELMKRMKQMLDPERKLNPGEFGL